MKESTDTFWKRVWENKATFNYNVKWLKQLENTYYNNVTSNNNNINLPLVNHIISKVQLQESLEGNLINSFWYKTLSFYQNKLTELYQQTYRINLALLSCLTLARTSLPHKNTEK